ncbi:MAG TPA: NAD(P)H-hydrate dehydratase [Smithellaceae bacterium]|nr:NAD(P)H-hydrate dehydratase [Smithellaceae bacterium]
MLLICGTIPIANFPLTMGAVAFAGDELFINEQKIPCTQGTAALVSAACVVADYCQIAPPHVLLAGDIGNGQGSRAIYDYLKKNIGRLSPNILLMHYILPVMGLMKKVVAAAEKCAEKPVLIADASSMYAAKAAGLAPRFDIFTPDLSEMAFLADPDAVHPAYISRHLFNSEILQVPELIAAACQNKNAPRLLIIKGAVDHIVEDGRVIATIREPDIPALEAIGGTGDTISGMISALIDAGVTASEAAITATKANRLAGQIISAKPATKIREIIAALPMALKNILKKEKKND